MGKTVVFGVTSGIAAVKVPRLIELVRKAGFSVEVIMTAHATRMMPVSEFEHASESKVYSDLFPETFDYKDMLSTRRVAHVDLADNAGLLVICPATANVIAKLAVGMADDFLTTTALATTAPILLCPSMNVHMWSHPTVAHNLEALRRRGVFILDPAVGKLACGYEGKGRLADVGLIAEEIFKIVSTTNELSGTRVIVTSGATVERIDPARIITNRSSGNMGAALADACRRRGADVVYICARLAVRPRQSTKEMVFETADELAHILMNATPAADIVFHAAAVSDFSVQSAGKGKLSSAREQILHLVPMPKILPKLKIWNPKATVVGFKAEAQPDTAKLKNAAEKKLQESGADFICANDISRSDRGFMADTNEVVIAGSSGSRLITLNYKHQVAEEIVEFVLQNLSGRM